MPANGRFLSPRSWIVQDGFGAMDEPLTLTLDITRKEYADNPYAFQEVEPQEYHVRDGAGQLSVAQFPWDAACVNDLAALHADVPDLEARQRMGHRLAAFLDRTCWASMESAILAAQKRGQNVFLTIRSSAAEIYSLPFELVSLQGSDQPLGRLPNLCISYEWPATQSAKEDPTPRNAGGRILIAYSSAGGLAVPAVEHQQAVTESLTTAGLSFDPNHDLIGGVTLTSLARGLARTATKEPVAILHLLVHGNEGGLAFSPDDVNAAIGHVDAMTLANLLQEYAGSLRCVVLSACQSGDSRRPDSHIVGIAQALHRAGIESVVAARFPLTIQGSITFAKAFYKSLLEIPSSVESAFVAAREALESEGHKTLDWASLQLYRRSSEGYDARPIVFRPYRGLLAFEEQHHKFFYGREHERSTLKSRMEDAILHRRPPFQMVVGAAGTGKSSLVMSGVATDLKKIGWNVVKLRPAERRGALPALFHALRKTRQVIKAELANEEIVPTSSAEALSRESKRFSYDARGRRWLLVIDQFEEVFTMESSAEERRVFVETLLELSRTPELSVVVLCIMRVDYMARIGEIIVRDGPTKYSLDRIAYDGQHTFSLTQMPHERLGDVMIKPAARVGMRFEPGLPERIMSDAGEEAAALPLLAYVLDELWLYRSGQCFTLEAYQRLNGFRGALGRAADAVFYSLDATQKRQAKRLLESMVSPGDGNRADARARAWTDLLKPTDPEQIAAFDVALAKFAQSRLIVIGDELPDDPGAGAWAELAHDSLLQQWQTLHEWIADDRDTLAEIAALRNRASQYIKEPNVAEYLLYGKQLAQALSLRDEKHEWLDRDCVALIEASQAAEARRKAALEAEAARIAAAKEAADARERQEWRRHMILAIVIIAVFSATTVLTYLSYRRSVETGVRLAETNAQVTEQQKRAEQSSKRARMTALLAISERLVDTDATRALVFLREIEEPQFLHGFEETALRALNRPAAESVIEGDHGAIRALMFTGDGGKLIAAASDGTIFTIPSTGGEERILTQHENGSNVVSLYLSPDGRRVISAGEDKDVRIASLDGPANVVTLGHVHPLQAIAINSKNGSIATASDSAPRIFDGSSATKLPRVLGTPGDTTRPITALAFRPDGLELVSGASDGKLGFHTLGAEHNAKFVDVIAGHIISLEYDPSGTRLLVLSDSDPADRANSGQALLLRTDSPAKPQSLANGALSYWAAFSPTGKYIALRNVDGAVRIISTSKDKEDVAVIWQDKLISRADWSTDGQSIMGVDQNDVLHVRRIGWSTDSLTIPIACSASRMAMSHDGTSIAVGCRAGEIRIFRVDGRLKPPEQISPNMRPNRVVSASWSTDGSRFAALVQQENGQSTLRYRETNPTPIITDLATITAGQELTLSPNGAYVAVLQGDQGVLVFPTKPAEASRGSTPKATESAPIRIADPAIHRVVFDTVGKHFATASNDGSACIFAVNGPEPLRCFLHKGAVRDISWLPSGKQILTASADGRARIYDLDKTEPIHQFIHESGVVRALASVDGQRVLTLTEHRTARIWTVTDGTFRAPDPKYGGRFVLAAISQKNILLVHHLGALLFDLDLTHEKPLLLEGGVIDSAAFSPDGDFVATLARDGATRVFRTESGELIATLNENSSFIGWLTWTTEPELSLMTATTDGVTQIRPFRIEDITRKLWGASAYCPSARLRERVLANDAEEARNGAESCRKRVAESRKTLQR